MYIDLPGRWLYIDDVLLLMSGVGGNLVAVQASRLSTALHKVSVPGTLPVNAVHGCPNPCTTFCGKGMQLQLLVGCPARVWCVACEERLQFHFIYAVMILFFIGVSFISVSWEVSERWRARTHQGLTSFCLCLDLSESMQCCWEFLRVAKEMSS